MGEAADDMIDGDVCEMCGVWLGDGEGFPRLCDDCASEADDDWERAEESALRDRFAGQAMQGILSYSGLTHHINDIAKTAYEIADAMLAAREKNFKKGAE